MCINRTRHFLLMLSISVISRFCFKLQFHLVCYMFNLRGLLFHSGLHVPKGLSSIHLQNKAFLLLSCRCFVSFKGTSFKFCYPFLSLTHLSTIFPLTLYLSHVLPVAHPFPIRPSNSLLLPPHLVPIFLYWHSSRFLNVFLNVALHSA